MQSLFNSGDIINRLKEVFNCTSNEQLASVLGTTKGTIGSWKNRNTIDFKLLIANCNPSDLGWILTGLKGYEPTKNELEAVTEPEERSSYGHNKKIPLYDGITVAGRGSVATMDPETQPTEYVDAGDWFRDANAAMRVHGDSMEPDYQPGSIVALRQVCNKQLVIYGQDYVIETDEYRVIKKLQKSDQEGYWLCCSSNQTTYESSGRLIHEPFDVPIDAVKRLFRVIGCVCRNESSSILVANQPL